MHHPVRLPTLSPIFASCLLGLALCACSEDAGFPPETGPVSDLDADRFEWSVPHRPANDYVAISAIDAENWMAVGYGGAVLQVRDGRQTMMRIGGGGNLTAVQLFASGQAIATSRSGGAFHFSGSAWKESSEGLRSAISGDGLGSEKCSPPPYRTAKLVARQPDDAYQLYAPKVLHFDGRIWERIETPVEIILDLALDPDRNELFVAGLNGQVARRSDGKWTSWDLGALMEDEGELHVAHAPGTGPCVLSSGGALARLHYGEWERIDDGSAQGYFRALYATPAGEIFAKTAEGYARFDGHRFVLEGGDVPVLVGYPQSVSFPRHGSPLALGPQGLVLRLDARLGWEPVNEDPLEQRLTGRMVAASAAPGQLWSGHSDGRVTLLDEKRELQEWNVSDRSIVALHVAADGSATAVDETATVFEFESGKGWSTAGSAELDARRANIATDGTPFAIGLSPAFNPEIGAVAELATVHRFVGGAWEGIPGSARFGVGQVYGVSATEFYVLHSPDYQGTKLLRFQDDSLAETLQPWPGIALPHLLLATPDGDLFLRVLSGYVPTPCGFEEPGSTFMRIDGEWTDRQDLAFWDVGTWTTDGYVAVGMELGVPAVFLGDGIEWTAIFPTRIQSMPRFLTTNAHANLWLHDWSRLVEYVE